MLRSKIRERKWKSSIFKEDRGILAKAGPLWILTLKIQRKKVVKKQDLGLYVMNTHIKGPCEQNAKLINKWGVGPQKLNQCLER